jgi:microcystin-dependent protein
MRAVRKSFQGAFIRIMAACIIIFALASCGSKDDLSEYEDDRNLGDAFYGSIILLANSAKAPDYFLAADGRYLSASYYSALHAILGDTYGDERYVGSDLQFALPLLNAPVPGVGYYICYQGWYPIRDRVGEVYNSYDYVGSISRFGGSYNPPGTYYCDGSLIDYLGSDTRLAVVLGVDFQFKDNLFTLPDLRSEIDTEEKMDAAKKSFIVHYGVMPNQYDNYSKSFYCGMVKLMAGHILPVGWKVCDGAELQVADYPLLYNAMTFGSTLPSTKPTSFFLPNLPGPVKGTNYIINTSGAWPFYRI